MKSIGLMAAIFVVWAIGGYVVFTTSYERGKRDGIAECEKNCKAEASIPHGCFLSNESGTASVAIPCDELSKPRAIAAKPVRKPAPRPKPCDPCEGIKGLREEMDRRFNNLEESRLRTMISVNGKEWMTCSREAPQEFCERLVKDFDSFHAQTADPCFGVPNCFTATDSQYQCITCGIPPVGNAFTFDGPCIDCPQEPHPNLPTPYTTPQSNGPGAFMFYTPPPGLHVDSHTTATTPEPRTLLLAAGGLTAIYALRKSA